MRNPTISSTPNVGFFVPRQRLGTQNPTYEDFVATSACCYMITMTVKNQLP
jgi:hypothetical protein